MSDMTPIEIVADHLGASLVADDMGGVGAVLVPEQCCLVYLGDRMFHLVLEEITDSTTTEKPKCHKET